MNQETSVLIRAITEIKTVEEGVVKLIIHFATKLAAAVEGTGERVKTDVVAIIQEMAGAARPLAGAVVAGTEKAAVAVEAAVVGAAVVAEELLSGPTELAPGEAETAAEAEADVFGPSAPEAPEELPTQPPPPTETGNEAGTPGPAAA